MKTKYIILLIVLLPFLGASCSGDFLNTESSVAVSGDEIFTSVEKAVTVLNGAYSYTGEYRYHTLATIATDVMGEDQTMTSGAYGFPTYNWNVYSYQYAQTPFDDPWWQGYSTYIWRYAYKAIDNCNSILANTSTILPEGDGKNDLIAQARGLRAVHYLLLVQLYARAYNDDPGSPGLVLITAPEGVDSEGVPRTTVADVYTVIIDDLTYAAENIVNTTGMDKLTPKAAALLLARAYLTMNDMENAKKYAEIAADNTFDGSNLMSQDEWRAGFKDHNREWLWYMNFISTNSNIYASIPSFYYYCKEVEGYPYGADVSLESLQESGVEVFSGYSTVRFTAAFRDMFEDSDCRKMFPFRVNASDGYFTSKFGHRSQMGDAEFVMCRIAEAYLIKAEAEALTNPGLAESVLNTLQVARGATPTSGDLLNNIYKERRKELYGEGFRLFDIKRLKQPLVRSGQPEHWTPLDLPANSPRFMLPLPDKEITANDMLSQADQNEYWR